MIRLDFKSLNVYIAEDFRSDLEKLIAPYSHEKIFVLTDQNSYRHCFPMIRGVNGIDENQVLVIEPGDDHKYIDAVVEVWKYLSHHGANRKSVLINLGGGMPTDLGGFAAATFKRGIRFMNIPTTLLSQVDASVGGKTGINFEGYKNEIGVFKNADAVLIDTAFLDTLDPENILSGFAEMIKHGLIYSEKSWNELSDFELKRENLPVLKTLVAESIAIKEHFVEADPTEKGIRKALNFGHTIGHAFESFALKQGQPLLHGYAVAYGMIAELYLSHIKLGFPIIEAESISRSILHRYGPFDIHEQYDHKIFDLTLHDKKNDSGRINFTLLERPGLVKIDIDCQEREIEQALSFFRSIQ